MTSLLITQCLQRDFVDPIGPHDPLPNRLHVGLAESARLLGADPRVGPLAQLMAWTTTQSADDLAVVHIRDWHDPDDVRQSDHLATFGSHCVRNTRGAEFVAPIADVVGGPVPYVVDSITLNDFVGTNLEALVEAVRARTGDQPLRVGVVGVWTEAKISFLLYELRTRLRVEELATCSALTAGASRAQHFHALGQLEKVLGVECFESVGEFVSWLRPGSTVPSVPAARGAAPRLAGPGLDVLDDDDRAIIGCLFRDCATVELAQLHGGFSTATVWHAVGVDVLGHRHAPAVLKLGPHGDVGRERVAFEHVEEMLGNHAPRVRGFVDLGERAGIKYSYAGMGRGGVTTLRSLFTSDVPDERLEAIVREVFDEVLAPLYAAARYERLPLLEHYGFTSDLAPVVADALTRLGIDPMATAVELPDGSSVPNLVRFYEMLDRDVPSTEHEFHYVSSVHGDLNAANVLLDGNQNLWIIDYFHTAVRHVLQDLAKFENDLLFLLTPIDDDATLADVFGLWKRALSDDLQAPLALDWEHEADPVLRRCGRLLSVVREIVGRLCRDDRQPRQYEIARLRYAAQTLGFVEASDHQKRFAAAVASVLADRVASSLRRDVALRVDWIDLELGVPGRIGMTLCPGRKDRGRDLAADLETLRAEGVDTLVGLVPDDELEWLGADAIAASCASFGIEYRSLAIADQGVPAVSDAEDLITFVQAAAERGNAVALFCRAGLGRTGLIAACTLVAWGWDPDAAIHALRRIRESRVVETEDQEQFVHAWARRRLAPGNN